MVRRKGKEKTIDENRIIDNLLKEFRYDEEDRQLITDKYHAAKQYLIAAGADDEGNPLYLAAISLITGIFLEDRDGQYSFDRLARLPVGMINSLRYSKELKENEKE